MFQPDRTISVAPMMSYTDRHCRTLLRLVSPNALLFSEMVTPGALLYGDAMHFLAHSQDEPCVLQLGGSNPEELKSCSLMAEEAGYQEVNLNVGCPSDRVRKGGIGACLMAEPGLVAECVAAMKSVVSIPVTVKCRIGIDQQDSYEFFRTFIRTVAEGGCSTFYVHARKAMLSGLSPRENREIPPLKYDYVYRINDEVPDCQFILNGGIKSVESALDQLKLVEGIMIGRMAYHDIFVLAELEHRLFGHSSLSRLNVIEKYLDYGRSCVKRGEQPRHLLKHLLGLFTGCPGARQFRRYLSEHMYKNESSFQIVYDALDVSGLAENIEPNRIKVS